MFANAPRLAKSVNIFLQTIPDIRYMKMRQKKFNSEWNGDSNNVYISFINNVSANYEKLPESGIKHLINAIFEHLWTIARSRWKYCNTRVTQRFLDSSHDKEHDGT